MTKEGSEASSIEEYILISIEKDKPKTVKQLIQLVQKKYKLPENEVMEHVLNLRSQGKLIFKESLALPSVISKAYVFSKQASWYWTIIALSITTTLVIFTVPEDFFPLVYARYLLGTLFILWLPGYSFIKALFPTEVPIPTKIEKLDNIERVVLSIAMSLVLYIFTGFLLNYTPWGIRVTPITLSLFALTTTLATTAVIREYQTKLQDQRIKK